ncbi:myrosinase 1-like [Cotesia typhae]|uniref:myrosinase 1-like n=1 Tax=Cotesia typhae TaxID=2053667 RepID=UPI003D69DF27
MQSNFYVHGSDITYRNNFTNNTIKNTFPDDFIFGVSTSAYQIEGAWNVDHKGESIWDRMTHERPDKIADGSNGDIADNSYYLYKTDNDLVKQLGANAYRISISWTRILPEGTSNYVNKDGINYYNNVINEMLNRNVTPYVTIFHWDLPQKLQDLGGWTNPKIIDWFVEYARVLFQEFGDRVKYWTTFNEPNIFCRFSYNGLLAPGLNESGQSDYSCAHHALLAHAETYRMYKKEFYETQKGSVGIVVAIMVEVPENASDPEELAESKLSWDFWNGWIINPIFSDHGDYPKAMKDRIAEYSAIQGFSQSRLPEFNSDQIQLVKNSADYFGFNFYSAFYIRKIKNYDIRSSVSRNGDVGVTVSSKKFPKDRNTPWAMEESLKRINENYNIPYFLITENGYWDEGTLCDTDRAQYFLDHLQGESIWDAMVHKRPDKIEDGSNGDIADNSYYLYKTDVDLVKQLRSKEETHIEYLYHGQEFCLMAPAITSIRTIKYWTTFNEPNIFCRWGYNGIFAPGLNESGRSDYICGHHALLAHAEAYRMYKKEFYETQKGTVGIVLSGIFAVPENETDPEEIEGAELSWDFWNGWIINPIFSNDGDYPKAMKDRIAKNSIIPGLSQSRLPKFTPEQIQLAMRKLLRRISKYYNVPYILITENGYWDEGALHDTDRAQYYLEHLREVSKLINEGLDIRGYFAWSLLDNFEWSFGYMQKYGLFAVDYKDSNR